MQLLFNQVLEEHLFCVHSHQLHKTYLNQNKISMLKNPIKPVARINEMAKEIEVIPATTNDTAIPPDQLIAHLKPYAGIIIMALQIVKFFTNDDTDKKIDSLIALLDTQVS